MWVTGLGSGAGNDGDVWTGVEHRLSARWPMGTAAVEYRVRPMRTVP